MRLRSLTCFPLIKATDGEGRVPTHQSVSWMMIVTTKTKDGMEAKRSHCTDFKGHISSLTPCIYLVVSTVFYSRINAGVLLSFWILYLSFFFFFPSFSYFAGNLLEVLSTPVWKGEANRLDRGRNLSPATGPTGPQWTPGSCETSCNYPCMDWSLDSGCHRTEPDLGRRQLSEAKDNLSRLIGWEHPPMWRSKSSSPGSGLLGSLAQRPLHNFSRKSK